MFGYGGIKRSRADFNSSDDVRCRCYVAGADAQTTYAARLQVGEEAFRKGIEQRFFG